MIILRNNDRNDENYKMKKSSRKDKAQRPKGIKKIFEVRNYYYCSFLQHVMNEQRWKCTYFNKVLRIEYGSKKKSRKFPYFFTHSTLVA